MGQNALILSSFFSSITLFCCWFSPHQSSMHQGISPHLCIFSMVMCVCAAHPKFPQTGRKLVQNFGKTQEKKAGCKQIDLFFFLLPPQKHNVNCFWKHGARAAQQDWHGTGTTGTPHTGLVILGKTLTHHSDCNLGWVTRLWLITPPVGQITLFPIVHMFTGLPMLIPSPQRFLGINLQLLMELVACFGNSIWILLIKFASIPMKTVRQDCFT